VEHPGTGLTSAAGAVQRPVDKTKPDHPQEQVDHLRNTRRPGFKEILSGSRFYGGAHLAGGARGM